MTIFHWLGQAGFLITTLAGMHVLIDPPGPMVGYKVAAHSIPADAVFVSHSHPDHNYVEAAEGAPTVKNPLTDQTTVTGKISAENNGKGDTVWYKRIFAYHDNVQGKERGTDTLTVINTGGLRILHMGDFGQMALTPGQLKDIGKVDVLMICVGGHFTVDGPQAAKIAGQIHPRVIIPMHYGTPALSERLRGLLAPPDAFIAAMKGKAAVVHVTARGLKLSPKTLPKKTTIYVLRYE